MIINLVVHTTQIYHLLVLEVRHSETDLADWGICPSLSIRKIRMQPSSKRGSSIILPTTKKEEFGEKLSLAPSI